MIIHCIVEEYIFAAIVYKLLVKKKYQNVLLMITIKFIVSKGLRCLRRVKMFDLKI